MNSQDLTTVGRKARRETEDFINHYIQDRGKGWPVFCPLGSESGGVRPAQQASKPNRIRMDFAKYPPKARGHNEDTEG